MKIHSILACSSVNGPGRRFVVWVQGCNRRCGGCFNQGAQSFAGGVEMSRGEILEEIDTHEVTGLTVSGGEPFEQEEDLAELLVSVKKMGLTTLVYTGYTWEELWDRKSTALKYCDWLIDGQYKKNIPTHCRWTGSGNQRVLLLQNGHITGDATEWEPYSETGEIIINENLHQIQELF